MKMAPKYYATVQYREGREINNTEDNVLYYLARSNKGVYRASNLRGGSVTFSFTEISQAERFKQQSRQLEDVVEIKLAELQ